LRTRTHSHVISTNWNALASYGDRFVVEAASDRWRLTGEQLLSGAAWLLKTLEPYSDRPLIAYLRKSPLYYAFTACSFLNSLNFCPVDIDNLIQRVLDIAAELPVSLILCDNDEVFALLRKHTEHCLEIYYPRISNTGPQMNRRVVAVRMRATTLRPRVAPDRRNWYKCLMLTPWRFQTGPYFLRNRRQHSLGAVFQYRFRSFVGGLPDGCLRWRHAGITFYTDGQRIQKVNTRECVENLLIAGATGRSHQRSNLRCQRRGGH
jgi:hypothetical protein